MAMNNKCLAIIIATFIPACYDFTLYKRPEGGAHANISADSGSSLSATDAMSRSLSDVSNEGNIKPPFDGSPENGSYGGSENTSPIKGSGGTSTSVVTGGTTAGSGGIAGKSYSGGAGGESVSVNAGGSTGTAGTGGTIDSRADVPEGCNCEGTFAMKVQIPVTWKSPQKDGGVAQSGTGTQLMTILNKQSYRAAESKYTQTLKACSISNPPFENVVMGVPFGKMEAAFPASLFDTGIQPDATAKTVPADGGKTSTQEGNQVFLFGFEFANPETDEIPANVTDAVKDHDNDTKAGITVERSPNADSDFSCSLFNCSATKLYMGVRTIASGTKATVTDSCPKCDNMTGTMKLEKTESKVYGCLKSDSTECSSNETSFLNSELPIYSPSLSEEATFTATRIKEAATCADVRAAYP
jgi:hypothetical protein